MAPLTTRWTDTFAALHPDAADTVTTLNPTYGHAPVRIVWASDHFGLWARFAWVR